MEKGVDRRSFVSGALVATALAAIAGAANAESQHDPHLAEAKYSDEAYKFIIRKRDNELVDLDGIQMPLYTFTLSIPKYPTVLPEKTRESLKSILQLLYKLHKSGALVLMDKDLLDEIDRFVNMYTSKTLASGNLAQEQKIFSEYAQLMSHIGENRIKEDAIPSVAAGLGTGGITYGLTKIATDNNDTALVASTFVGGLTTFMTYLANDKNYKQSIKDALIHSSEGQQIKRIIVVKRAD